MEFGLTAEQEALRLEIQQFLEQEAELVEEVRKETDSALGYGPYTREFHHKVGARGWLTPHWPKEYGGLDSGFIDRMVIAEELACAGARPTPVGATMAGPVILLFGTDEQKREFLPGISSGEIEFALGYTEPEAGSDLAALDLRAVEEDDCYVLNGQKVFSTSSHFADYHWLAVRTDPTLPRHKGISLFVVKLDSPGITIRPLWTMGGMRTNEVFYDDVRVPKNCLVGEKNKGWYYLGIALGLERTWVVGETKRYFDMIVAFLKDNPEYLTTQIRQKLAQLSIEVQITYLFGCRIAWVVNKGENLTYETAVAKVFGSELDNRLNNVAMEIFGLYSLLTEDSKHAIFEGHLGRTYLTSLRKLLTRGTSEVMRNSIALRGLKLPHGG